MVTSFHGQTIPFHRSFYSFSVKLNVKFTFFCLWLKERGVHMRSALFFLYTYEKFNVIWYDY